MVLWQAADSIEEIIHGMHQTKIRSALLSTTHHEAGLGSHAVGHGLDPAVGEEDAVLPRHLYT